MKTNLIVFNLFNLEVNCKSKQLSDIMYRTQ